jgi:hypothetical protein
MPIEAILHEVEPLHDRQRAAGGATSVWVRAAKRKFRIVRRENNIPVLGVCEYCNAEFAADPETIGRPKDAHAYIQKQFVAHKCKRVGASKNVVALPVKWRTLLEVSQTAANGHILGKGHS